MKTRLYIGTYTEDILFGTGQILEGKGEGIYVFDVDSESGKLLTEPRITAARNPSYLAISPGGEYLWAVNELKAFDGEETGAVSAFQIDPSDGSLRYLNSKPTGGTDPCHISIDNSGRHVFVANFMSGSVCVYRIGADGRLESRTDFVQHRGGTRVVPGRQEGPHAHAVVLDRSNLAAYVPDLGLDRTVVYSFDEQSGSLQACPELDITSDPGFGPRQIAIGKDGREAYIVNELDSSLTILRRSSSAARFEPIKTLSSLPEDFVGHNSCAELQLSPNGRFVYVSNRGHNSISVFALEDTGGGVKRVETFSSGGNVPRSFAVDSSGRYLAVANQDSDNLVIFELEKDTGVPKKVLLEQPVPTPVCVKYAISDR